MPTWEELLKNRKPIPSLVNSAHLLECVKLVKEKYPTAVIEELDKGWWRLVSDGVALSNKHNSHYACWSEARELLNVAD